MRLTSQLYREIENPSEWIAALAEKGFSTASEFPVEGDAAPDVIQGYLDAARDAGIRIAEVGAWSNPLSPDEAERKRALAYCKSQLALADMAGAACCSNIAGSRGPKWDGPHAADLTEETFEMIVESVREIIDEVRPTRTFYSLETMPWMYPDSADSYERLIRAIDREAFAVHFDPVNLINCPSRYFANGELMRDFVKRLGPHIKAVHAKDSMLAGELTVHLSEEVPGRGGLDWRAFLEIVDSLGPDIPVIVEHIASEADCDEALAHIVTLAKEMDVVLR